MALPGSFRYSADGLLLTIRITLARAICLEREADRDNQDWPGGPAGRRETDVLGCAQTAVKLRWPAGQLTGAEIEIALGAHWVRMGLAAKKGWY
eukprot:CAMPEP_0195051688 /NCGR_PEP_ID=MMETSP0448-20130528/1203_1 /TAXON_ID=66468 /ORGANISM="Heterocapsa triquestra, Strain CCMP 448" /LENGTH=93 /DNA_ID=CAMNT_0040080725 /DNA_START=108 /DNA_END=390 /DNA_ORIENTATION=+